MAAQPQRVRAFTQGPDSLAAISPSTPAVRGRDAVIAWLGQRVEVSVVANGHVLVRTRGGLLPTDVGQVLDAYGPRLLGPWLGGREPTCDLCSQPAIVPAAVDAVLCAEHAT